MYLADEVARLGLPRTVPILWRLARGLFKQARWSWRRGRAHRAVNPRAAYPVSMAGLNEQRQSEVAKAAGGEDGRAREQALLEDAVALAQEALALDDGCAPAHKWFAICKGSLSAFVPTKEKIELGFVFRDHVLRAIALAPEDPTNHHLLGRWSFEVASLSWFERRAAAALFAAPPEATFDETLALFTKAEELR